MGLSISISNGRKERKDVTAQAEVRLKQQEEKDKQAAAEGTMPLVIDSSFAALKRQHAGS
jgi:hypothetical protein